MKRILGILLTAAMIFTMLGCSKASNSEGDTNDSGSKTAASGDGSDFLVGLCFGSMDFTPQVLSEDLINGFKEKNWDYVLTNADQDVNKLLTDVENAITKGADVIICRGITNDGMNPIAEKCAEAKVPLITLSVNPADENKYLCGVYDSYEAAAQMIADEVKKEIDASPEEPVNIGYIIGTYDFESLLCRWKTIEETCPTATTLDVKEGNWTADGAMSVTEDWLQKYKDMNYLVVASDEMAIGVIQALQSAGKKTEDYHIYSYDGIPSIQPYVESGWVDCSAKLDLQRQSDKVIEVLQTVKDGKSSSLPKQVKPYGILPYTPENCKAIDAGGDLEDYYYKY